MSRHIFFQVTAPVVIIGFVLFLTCLVCAWNVAWLQSNLNEILTSNVSSMQAGQQLENRARQLRFHCFLYLIEPNQQLWEQIQKDEIQFGRWLLQAKKYANTPQEEECIQDIREGYRLYREGFERLVQEGRQGGVKQGFWRLDEAHPIRHVTDPCAKYSQINEEMMDEAFRQSEKVTQRLHLAMLLVGLGGPLGGLLSGFGIARGLRRSLYRLRVRVQDAAQQLKRDLPTVSLTADGDMEQIDQQLEHVVQRVTEVTTELQKQQQEMLRAQQLAAVGQLAASVAHEVRNPLTGIKLLVEAALRTSKPRPFTLENLQVVHGEILRLEQIVQNFLDFARPPALQRVQCDVCELIQRAVNLVVTRARQQQVALEVHCPETPVFAQVDSNQFCTVLVNLLLNGLDAMPRGGRLIVTLDTDHQGLRFRVEDTGAGLSPAMAERLFTPFSSTKETGSGLGLSICRRIIEEHGGRITGGNREGGGACFTFRLPAQMGLTPAGLPGR